MTCQDVRARMDGYARGTLDARETEAFEAHLERCDACASLVLGAETAPAGTEALPRSIEPAADLWPALRDRIAGRARRRGRVTLPRWTLAAAALLLITLSSGVTAMWLTRAGRERGVPTRDVSAVEAQYAAASEDLARALDGARKTLPRETIATIEKNLGIIDRALEESRQALARDPGNPALGELVVAVWRQKVDLLRRATALGSKS